MKVTEAIQTAKDHLLDLFKDEQPSNVGLEEVIFEDRVKAWDVTFGFSRPWENRLSIGPVLRTYKVIRIDDATGAVKSVKSRLALV